MSWKGTAVPNSGTIEKVYFNTNLSVDEVLNTINSLEFKEVIEGSGLYAYNVVWGYYGTDEATFFQILIQKYEDKIIIEYKSSKNGVHQNLFTYNVDESENGWTGNVVSPIIPSETPCNLRNVKDGIPIGDQNDKLSSLFSITPFEEVQEEVTLDDWAEGIADAIREKKEITTGNWVGETVPNSGTIGKVYFNTKLSVEEVKSIIDTLIPHEDTIRMYIVCSSNTQSGISLITTKANAGTLHDFQYGIALMDGRYNDADSRFTPIWSSEEGGWKLGNVSLNMSLISSDDVYENIGEQNDKLSSLISTSPFYRKIPRLNFAQEIRSIEGGNSMPTAVPISGMVDNVYFNFNLDISKIAEIIVNLPYIYVPDVGTVYPIISNADMTDGLLILRQNVNEYYITRGVEMYAKLTIASTEPEYEFRLYDNKDTSGFYKNDFTKPIEFGFENYVELLAAQLPNYVNQNELLKEMISITPIQKVGSGSIEGIIEVEELPTPEYSGTAVPNTGYVENVYFNTNLTKEEVVNILNSWITEDYVLIVSEDYSTGIKIMKHTTEGWFDIMYLNNNSPQTIFSSVPENSLTHGAGWVENLGFNYIEINKNVLDEAMGMIVGAENDKLSSLFSITPFEVSGIDTTKIYYLNQKVGDICAYTGSFWASMKDIVENNGGKVYVIVVKDKPTENIKVTDLNSMIIYAYFVENENDIFLYADWSGDGNPFWLSFGVAMFSGEVTYGGQITDVSEATDPTKYYTMAVQKFYKYSNGWVEYKYGGIIPEGRLTVTQNGEYDITSYKTVNVNIEDKSLEVHKMYLTNSTINWQSISWDKFNSTFPLKGHIFRERTITGLDSGKLIIPECVSSIGEYCFYHCQSITEVSFDGNSCVSIGQWCFSGCKKLTSIIFPDDIKTIPISVASGCDLLTNVVLSKNCTRIERNAFEICDNLTYVEIPATVTYIGLQAFQATSSNDKLLTVKMLGSTPPILGDISRGFTLVFLVDKILIPSGSLADYEEDWKIYVGKFEEY